MSTINERLAKHVADFGVFYTKLHNYHWHVYGPDFVHAHTAIEKLYEGITENYDSAAERVVQLGGEAPASLAEYLKLAGIKEETKKSFTSKEAFTSIKKDFEYLLAELKITQKEAADSGDVTTDGIISGMIAEYEKTIWFLSATLK